MASTNPQTALKDEVAPKTRMSPEDMIHDLIRHYGSISEPSPLLSNILRKPDELARLCDAVERQLQLTKHRSRDIADGQVTIYDKALLALAQKSCNRTLSLGTLELYISEVLGVITDRDIVEGEDIVRTQASLFKILPRGTKPAQSPDLSTGFDKKTRSYRAGRKRRRRTSFSPRSDNNQHPHPHHAHGHLSSSDESASDERLSRMLDVYERAKSQFWHLENRNHNGGGGADDETARFLRDTAENAINYIRARGWTRHEMLNELEDVFAIARDKATELAGGRKRRFEIGFEDRGGGRDRDRRSGWGSDERRGVRRPDRYRPGFS